MPITYELEAQRKLVLVTYTGTVSGEDVKQHFEELDREVDLAPDWRCLVDATGVDSAEFSFASIKALIGALGKERLFRWQSAIVTDRDVVYGLSRIYQALSESSGGRVLAFRDAGQALEWLEAT